MKVFNRYCVDFDIERYFCFLNLVLMCNYFLRKGGIDFFNY